MGREISGLKQRNITIVPDNITFVDHGMLFSSREGPLGCLDEDRILLVCLEQDSEDKNVCVRLPVEKISPDTDGRLFLGTVYGTRCEIQTDRIWKTAGELLMEMVCHYPWLWVGDHACLDSRDKRKWQELRNMVEQMRACCILYD